MNRDELMEAAMEAAAKSSFEQIDASGNFVSLYTGNYKVSALCAAQLGYAMMTVSEAFFCCS